jgi:hypothetical protein
VKPLLYGSQPATSPLICFHRPVFTDYKLERWASQNNLAIPDTTRQYTFSAISLRISDLSHKHDKLLQLRRHLLAYFWIVYNAIAATIDDLRTIIDNNRLISRTTGIIYRGVATFRSTRVICFSLNI